MICGVLCGHPQTPQITHKSPQIVDSTNLWIHNFSHSTLPDKFEKLSEKLYTIGLMSIEIKHLLEASISEKSDFKSRVKAYDQKCIILVHPFLSEFTKPFPQQYDRALHEILAGSFNNNLPLVIAEEAGASITNLAYKLTKYANGTIYTLPTRPQSPRPEPPFDWQDLNRALLDSGVKTARLGGQRFEFASMDDPAILDEHPYADWFIDKMHDGNQDELIKKRVLPYGCGGMLMCKLMTAGINVELLSASYPSNKIALPKNRILIPT